MVLLQRNSTRQSDKSGAPERPHLLEISSNCNWEPIRGLLLGRMSAICSLMGDFPPEMTFAINKYHIMVLPKPGKTTPIPPNLQPVLKTKEMFAIRLKITPQGMHDAVWSEWEFDLTQIIKPRTFCLGGKRNFTGSNVKLGESSNNTYRRCKNV